MIRKHAHATATVNIVLLTLLCFGSIVIPGFAREEAEFLAESTVPPDYAPDPVAPLPPLSNKPTWVVDPYKAGSSLPPKGTASLFDQLFVRKDASGESNSGYTVPSPLPVLLQEIEDASKPTGLGAARGVLIPMGRSLQRIASLEDITMRDLASAELELLQSMPEEWFLGEFFRKEQFKDLQKYLIPFFERPRIVVSPVAWPNQESGAAGTLMKERIYVGYHQSVDVLEVISYNDMAGRFEFQIVRNYSKPKEQEVLYANRGLCVGCHQNHAPIFSVAPWTETNATNSLSSGQPYFSTAAMVKKYIDPSGLDASGEKYFGVDVVNSLSTARAIDTNTDRANDFSLFQKLWQEGCPDNLCRAQALALIFWRGIDSSDAYLKSDLYRKEFVPNYAKNWDRLWPGGLNVPDPDIAVRNSLRTRRHDSVGTSAVDMDKRLGSFLNFVHAKENPGKPRRPKTLLRKSMDIHRPRMVEGFARYFLSKADYAQILNYLDPNSENDSRKNADLLLAKIQLHLASRGDYSYALNGERPFRRKDILRFIYASLGVDPLVHVAPDRQDLMTPQAAEKTLLEGTRIGLQISNPVDLFQNTATRCINCHAKKANETHFPNYLRPVFEGAPEGTQLEFLENCAARIYVHLRMWDLEAEERRVKDRDDILAMPLDGPITNTAMRGALLEFIIELLEPKKSDPAIAKLLEVERLFNESPSEALSLLQNEVEYNALPACPKFFGE